MLKIEDLMLRQGKFSASFSLQAEAGEKIVITGESGSGKSSLLNLIAGFLQPDSGQLRWREKDLLPLAPHQRPVTTLFQENNLFGHLDVWHNVALGIHPGAILTTAQQQAVRETLAQVELPDMEKRLPQTLSGGQQQRVALARCLLRQQPVLLLDEPYSSLDTATRKKVLGLTKNLVETRGLTLIMVTHNPAEAELIGARILTLKNGRLS